MIEGERGRETKSVQDREIEVKDIHQQVDITIILKLDRAYYALHTAKYMQSWRENATEADVGREGKRKEERLASSERNILHDNIPKPKPKRPKHSN